MQVPPQAQLVQEGLVMGLGDILPLPFPAAVLHPHCNTAPNGEDLPPLLLTCLPHRPVPAGPACHLGTEGTTHINPKLQTC